MQFKSFSQKYSMLIILASLWSLKWGGHRLVFCLIEYFTYCAYVQQSFKWLKTFCLSLSRVCLQATNPLTIHFPSQSFILPRQHPDTAPSKHSDLEADLLADALAVAVAVRVRHDRQPFLLRHGPLPDVLQPPGAAQLLGQQGLELGALDGAQQDHRL